MGRAVAVTPRVACLPRVAALLRVASLLHCCCAALVPKPPTPAAPSPKVPKPPHSGYHISALHLSQLNVCGVPDERLFVQSRACAGPEVVGGRRVVPLGWIYSPLIYIYFW